MGENVLEKLGEDISDEDAINLQTYIAFSYVAIGDSVNAQKYFENILLIDKDYSLNEEFVSPKIIKVFEKAKDRINYLIKDMPSYYNIQNPKIVINYSKTNLLLKSAIVPGWGQYSIDKKYKALSLGTAFSIATVGAIVSYFTMDNARTRYENASTIDEAVEYYNSYNNLSKINRAFIDFTIIVYFINLWDILWLE